MTEGNRTELLLPILKQIQGDLARVFRKLEENSAILNELRLEVHFIRGEQLRQLTAISSLEHDMGRVKRRLDLIDEIPQRDGE